MKTLEIHTQQEYDDNKDFDGILIIKSDQWITVSGSSTVVAWESSRVVARGSSTVEAWESSTVVAWGSSTVVARGSSTVVAWESSRVEAWESSTVEAWESSRVVAWGSSTVVARGSSTVVAWESSRVKALDNASILIHDKPQIELFGNATSKLWVRPEYSTEIIPFLAQTQGEYFVLYKSVNPETNCDFRTGKVKYEIGKEVEADDFDPDINRECGGGLHLCFSARKTQDFNEGKILKCLVKLEDIVVFHENVDKVRCRKVLPICEVDIWGGEIK